MKELRIDVKYITVSDAAADTCISLNHRPVIIKVQNSRGAFTQFIENPDSLTMYLCNQVHVDENPDRVIVLVQTE